MTFEAQLANLLSKNPSLMSVDVDKISEVQVHTLLYALENNTSVSTLAIRNTRLSQEHISSIARLLPNMKIVALNLEGCNIGIDGIKKLNSALAGSTTLTTLRLSGNRLSNRSSESLTGIIRTCPNLEELILDDNLLQFDANSQLLDELIASDRLKNVDLSDQTINDAGGMGKIIELVNKRSLKSLALDNTVLKFVLSKSMADRFIDAVTNNTALQKIDLDLSDEDYNIDDTMSRLENAVLKIIHERNNLATVSQPLLLSGVLNEAVDTAAGPSSDPAEHRDKRAKHH